jgi:hypothetical protein
MPLWRRRPKASREVDGSGVFQQKREIGLLCLGEAIPGQIDHLSGAVDSKGEPFRNHPGDMGGDLSVTRPDGQNPVAFLQIQLGEEFQGPSLLAG